MTPISIEIENFGSHTKSKLDFDFTSALVIGEIDGTNGASNGSGKSSVFNAITWALTGKSKYKNSSDIIKRGKDSTRVTFLFEHKGLCYKIIRARNKNDKVTLNFYRIIGDQTEEITADTNSQLDDKISEITKITYTGFTNTSYFAQNSISEFMYGTASDRQKIVAEILSLDRWSEYSNNASKKLKTIDSELDIVRFKLSQITDIAIHIAATKSKVKDTEKQISQLKDKKKVLLSDIEQLRQKVIESRRAAEAAKSIETLKREQETLNTKLTHLNKSILDKHLQLDAQRRAIFDLQSDLSTKTDKIRKTEAQLSEIRLVDNLADLESKIMFGRAKLDLLKQQLSASVEGGVCATCGYNWDTKNHNHDLENERRKGEITELEAKLEKAGVKAEMGRRLQLEHNSLTAELSRLKSSVALIGGQISNAESRVELIQSEIGSMEDQKAKASDRMSVVLSDLQNATLVPIDADNDAVHRLAALESDIDATDNQISSMSVELGSFKNKLDDLKTKESEKDVLKARAEELAKESGTLTNLIKVFGKGGVQATIVDNLIDELQKISNHYLNEFCHKPTYVKFITQKSDRNGAVKETLDLEISTSTGTSPFESLSGGEQFRVAFAVRLALSTIQAKRMGGELQLLMLDEVSSSLDKSGLETFAGIIKRLEKSMKILVITHDDALKEYFDTIITVKNTNGDSFVHR